jgi:hypothetical protein
VVRWEFPRLEDRARNGVSAVHRSRPFCWVWIIGSICQFSLRRTFWTAGGLNRMFIDSLRPGAVGGMAGIWWDVQSGADEEGRGQRAGSLRALAPLDGLEGLVCWPAIAPGKADGRTRVRFGGDGEGLWRPPKSVSFESEPQGGTSPISPLRGCGLAGWITSGQIPAIRACTEIPMDTQAMALTGARDFSQPCCLFRSFVPRG